MKSILLFRNIVLTSAILMSGVSICAQEQLTEYYPIGTTWEEVFTLPNGQNILSDYRYRRRLEVNRDTIIDGKTYKIVTRDIVESSNGQTGPESSLYIREKNDSVFCWDIPNHKDEQLIYNFNWQEDTDNFRWVAFDHNRKELAYSQIVLEDGKTYDCFSKGIYPGFSQLIWSIGETIGGILTYSSNRSGTYYLTKFSRNGVLLYENEVFSNVPVDNQRHTVVVDGPGHLESILAQDPLTDADSLTVYGFLNGSDIRTLRGMLGAEDLQPSDTEGSLHNLDLTPAHISAGGEDYITLMGGNLFAATDTIGAYMFSLCPLMEEVKLPYGVKAIGDGAFMGSQSLRRVTIPEKVRTIGSVVFQDCASLESVSLPYTITGLGDRLVEGCTYLRSVACAATEPPACTEITFGDMTGVTLYVPMGCAQKYRESMGWSRFADIVEPDPMAIHVDEAGTLESIINSLALDNVGQMKVTGELNGNDIRTLRRMLGGVYNTALEESSRGKLYDLDLSDAVIVSGGQDYFFKEVMKDSYLPPMCTNTDNDVIGQYTFAMCKNLEQIALPSGIKAIGDNAFYDSYRLKELTVPEGVETIGSRAFYVCSAMKHLSLPSTLIHMGDLVGGKGLQSVTCMATEPPVCTVATFSMTDTSAVLYVPAGCVEKYSNSVGWREFFDIREYDPLGISHLPEPLQEKREGIYDLQGRKLSSIPTKGFYIQNGRKHVVR